MGNRFDLYGVLGVVAMVVTPLAAAILFGWGLFGFLVAEAVPLLLAVVGGVAGAVAIECVGIFAGHVGMDYVHRRDWRAVFAVLAMGFYVWLGWSKVPVYGEVFVLAAFVYVLVALRHEAVAVDDGALAVEADEVAWKRERWRENRRLKHEERLAEIAAQDANDAAHGSQDATLSERSATLYECVCGKVYESPQGYSAHTRWCDVYKGSPTPDLPQGEREPVAGLNGNGGG